MTRSGVAALATLATLCLLVFIGPLGWVAPPDAIDPANRLADPSSAHPLGTDEFGRDVLSRLLHGGQVTLMVGVSAMVAALTLGVLVGGTAGFYGGWIDAVLMRLTDAMMAVPSFFVAIIALTVLGSSVPTLVLVIGVLSWMPVARVVYGETLRWKAAEFVVAAESVGLTPVRILVRHVLPQAVPSLLVAATLGVAYAILVESAVSYLGLGVQAPMPSWGNMLQNAQQYVFTAPLLALYPGAAITVTALTFNFLGDGLRDALDVRARTR